MENKKISITTVSIEKVTVSIHKVRSASGGGDSDASEERYARLLESFANEPGVESGEGGAVKKQAKE